MGTKTNQMIENTLITELFNKLKDKSKLIDHEGAKKVAEWLKYNGVENLTKQNNIISIVNDQLSKQFSKTKSKQSDDNKIYTEAVLTTAIPNNGLKVHKERKSVFGPIKKLNN